MRCLRVSETHRWLAGVLASVGLLFLAVPGHAQMTAGGATGGGAGGGGGGFGGGSVGTGTGTGTAARAGAAGGATGSTAAGVTAAGPSTTAGPGISINNASNGLSTSNILGGYYANPLAAGISASGRTGVRARGNFTQTLYTTTATAATALGRGAGVTAGITAGGLGASTAPPTGRRAPAYTATLGFKVRPIDINKVQGDVTAALARSSALEASRGIEVTMDGPVLVLRGQAADEHDSRLAEALARMTPGVRNVRNELKFREELPPPGAVSSQ